MCNVLMIFVNSPNELEIIVCYSNLHFLVVVVVCFLQNVILVSEECNLSFVYLFGINSFIHYRSIVRFSLFFSYFKNNDDNFFSFFSVQLRHSFSACLSRSLFISLSYI